MEKETRYTPEEAQEEAEKMQAKMATGESFDYSEAEKAVEMDKFLDEAVYPELQLTDVDRQKALDVAAEKGKTPEELKIIDRSFQNVRDTLKSYFNELTMNGLADIVSAEKTEHQIVGEGRERGLQELLETPEYSEYSFTNLEEVQQEKGRLIKERDSIILALGPGEQVEITLGEKEPPPEVNELQHKINKLSGLQDKILGWQTLNEADTTVGRAYVEGQNKAREIRNNRQQIPPETAYVYLKDEMNRESSSITLSHECSMRAIDRGLSSEAEVGITALQGEELQRAIGRRIADGWTDQYRAGEDGYLKTRRRIEKELGYEGKTVTYGVLLSGDETPSVGYGPVTLVLNPDSFDELFFSEGDSIPGLYNTGELTGYKKGTITAEKDMDEYLADYARKRQLTGDHALISKAARSVMAQEKAALNGDELHLSSKFDYTEAHIIGGIPFDRDHIKEIRTKTESEATEVESKIKGTAMDGTPVSVR